MSDVSATFVARITLRSDAGRQRLVLLLGRERAVERQHARPRQRAELGLRAADLRRAREEAEHVAAGPREHGAHGLGERRARRVAHLDRMRARRGLDHRAAAEEARNRSGVERRRHHEQAQLGARAPRLAREGERQVGVEAALVELVEHDRPEAGEQRVRLQPPREHALGRDEQPRLLREALLEAHLAAHLLAERPAVLGGDAPGDRARRHPPRLKQEHRPVGRQERRDARRLSRAGRSHEHRGARLAQRRLDAREVRIDGQRRGHRHRL